MTQSAVGSERKRFIEHENCTEYSPEIWKIVLKNEGSSGSIVHH